MARLRYTELARKDLRKIWFQIAEDSISKADAVVDRITSRCLRLVDFPESGPSRPGIAGDVRIVVVERWLATYRVTPNGVQIVRIADGRRDLSRLVLLRK